jgi:hypothetical protein
MQKGITGIILLLLLSTSLLAQTRTAIRKGSTGKYPTKTRTYLSCKNPFPACFMGRWKGQMEWRVAGKPTQTFAMQLLIQPADSSNTYTWQIIYGDKGTDNRPYLLKPIDTAKGHWAIDERNGIVLDSYVHGDALHGMFTVQGNSILSNYRLESGKLRVEFFSIKLNDKKTSGKGTDDSPTVESYRVSSYQVGVLGRVD